MINRFVKMTFHPENIDRFKDIFIASQPLIAAMEGCIHVELMQDINNPSVFFTYSTWESPVFLEAYRHSELFQGVWAKTKILFSDKPEAWSVNPL